MPRQLISYIAHAAPATRRPATGDEPFLRPEIGFTPRWYSTATGGIDFGARWHTDPAYRADTVLAMAQVTQQRFGARAHIGPLQQPGQLTDLITGVFGALMVPALYGAPIWWQAQDWPWSEHGQHVTGEMIDALAPPDLDNNAFWQAFMAQLDWIARYVPRLDGYINWQSVINSGYRLRGEAIFTDMVENPGRVHHLFACIAATMIDGARRLYARQAATGVEVSHFTVSNCLVNLLSPRHYAAFVLPHDQRIAAAFGCIGIHNCAWNATPYLKHYATVPDVAYIDMGIDSDLALAAARFPHARRALMLTPMDIQHKSTAELRHDLEAIAAAYAPCDLVCADIDLGVPDARISEIVDLCEELSARHDADADAGRVRA